MIPANLCIIEADGKILLKLATRGVSKGKWNFPGGKKDESETEVEAVEREVLEETGLNVSALEKSASLNFYEDSEVSWVVHVYKTANFVGEPRETEEGPLKWFDRNDLPFRLMWEDDHIWVPMVMKGRKIDCDFHFTKGLGSMLRYAIRDAKF